MELIRAERQRQIDEEKWTAEHDDRHERHELSIAACGYQVAGIYGNFQVPMNWPWDVAWWKPRGDRKRCLVKAGALFLAERDRCERKQRDAIEGICVGYWKSKARMAEEQAQECARLLDEHLKGEEKPVKKVLGKIQAVDVGLEGGHGSEFGLNLTFSGEWGKMKCFSPADQAKLEGFLADAKVTLVSDLAGKPVEITFQGSCFETAPASWRILGEVL